MNQQLLPTLVLGLGKTGFSVARHLSARGVPVAVTDTRADPPALEQLREQLPQVKAFVGGFREQQFSRAKRLVVSPGVDLGHSLIQAAINRGVEVIGDIELFARARRRPVVAVTGTNGKSTVTTLVGAMARRAGQRVAVGGNIGTPALNFLDIPMSQAPSFYVLELSSFQLELTESLNAEVAALLNISADHLDRHRSMAAYREIKGRIFRRTAGASAGVAVFNPQELGLREMNLYGREVHRFLMAEPKPGDFGVRVDSNGIEHLVRGGQTLIAADELGMRGRHNVANALAALAIGEVVGFDLEPMLDTLRAFKGLPHRTQLVASFNDIDWYDDSKGTNIGATEAAVTGLPGTLVLIMGGVSKGQDFYPLTRILPGKARGVVLMGQDAKKIASDIQGSVPTLIVKDMAEAVYEAHLMAKPRDSVLLSPGCASFDQYHDFQHRGEDFREKVVALQHRLEADE